MYTIIYDRRLIKVANEGFILLFNIGLSNDYISYKKLAKKWELVKNNNKKLLTVNDIKEIAERYDCCTFAKAHKHFFEKGELKKYILSSLSNPFTIEEAISWNEETNTLILTINEDKIFIKSSKALLEHLEEATNVEFLGRDFTPKKREFKRNFINDKKTFFTLCNPNGHQYLSGVTINGYKFQKNPTDGIIRFNSPEEALTFKNKYPILVDFKVRQMKIYTSYYVLKTESGQYYKSKRKYTSLYVPNIDIAKIFKTENLAKKYLAEYDLKGLSIEKIDKNIYLPA